MRDPRRGLLRVQPARGPRRLDRAARAPPQPRAAADLLQGPRPVRAARRLRAVRLRGAARARSTRCASRSSATPSRRPPRSRRSPTRTRSIERVDAHRRRAHLGRRAPARARPRAGRLAGELLLGSTSATERDEAARSWRGCAERGVLVRGGGALGSRAPALRVTYGLPEENTRFLDALAEVLARAPRAERRGPGGRRRACAVTPIAFTARPRPIVCYKPSRRP